MSRKNKLLERFLSNPESVKYPDIENILLDLGFIKSYGKGSHRNFRHPMLNIRITIPIHQNDCLSFYKKKLVKILKNKFFNYDQ